MSATSTPQTPWPKSIGRPATNALTEAGYTHLEQLTQISEKDLLKLHGVGPRAVGILRQLLVERGLSFKA
ncbi:MAG: DNA-binding protein [Anaerolineae bacterium]|jgi:hypothetical protein|nr:DNA-binding protein [Anaerolineae bacterium]